MDSPEACPSASRVKDMPGAPQSPQVVPASATASNLDNDAALSALSQSSRLAQSAPVAPQTMSPAAAHSAAPFAFGVPAWAPPGFQLQPQAEVIVPASKD